MKQVDETILGIMRQLGTATVTDMQQHVPYHRTTIRASMRRLVDAGHLGESTIIVEHDIPRWRSLDFPGSPEIWNDAKKRSKASLWRLK